MKCSKCAFANRDGAKFCNECGAKLELPCPACGSRNRPEGKFCDACGHSLAVTPEAPARPAPPSDPIAKLRRYLPTGLAEKILAQRDRIEGERRQVTVLFCDLEGFTPLTENLGPEEAYALMDRVYEILIHKIQDFEGTVNEMTGDGVMALFGAPIALEDAPQRAIRSALAIHWEMARFSEQLRKDATLRLKTSSPLAGEDRGAGESESAPSPGPSREGRGDERDVLPLRMRIGIHTGPVVVGTLGNDLRVEFKAVGDTVNLASRMEGLAEPGTTYVTGDTLKLTEGLFRFEGLGKKEIKGKSDPVDVYRVIAPSTRRTRFDVSAERGLTPFVGRQRELELLLDAYDRAKSARGQAVSIVADAGVGKSRFLYEFRKAVTAEDVTFLEGKCLSYSRSVPYHPVIDILKANFDIHEGQRDPEIHEKVRRGLKALQVDEGSTLPFLLELLGVEDSGFEPLSLSPEGKKDRTLQALARIVLKGAEVRPLILAVEDLQWADRSSEDAFKEILAHIAGARVLLLFTYRSEYVHSWGQRSYHSHVHLNRLSGRESLGMVTHLLGTERVAEDLVDLILGKTEGVPFFVEEFVKSLRDLHLIEPRDHTYVLTKDPKDLAIPSTIQDVLRARVDALPEGAKEVLQIGSVIEREFPHALIQKATQLSEKDLLSHLSALKDAELLYERGVYPDSTYVFKHALTREVVYSSILGKRRRELHEAIGQAIEGLFREDLDQHAGVLCGHFLASENYAKGGEYARLAGRHADKAAAFEEAITYTEKRVHCLEKLPDTPELGRARVAARTALGQYRIQLGEHLEAREAIAPILEAARNLGYRKGLARVEQILGWAALWVEEDLPDVFARLEDALRLAKEMGDPITWVLSHTGLGWAHLFSCEFDKVTDHYSQARAISQAAGRRWGVAFLTADLSFVHNQSGDVDLGYRTSEEALRLAEESGDIFSKASARCRHGASCYHRGLLPEAIRYLTESLALSERVGHRNLEWMAHLYLSWTYLELGDSGKMAALAARALAALEAGRELPSVQNQCRVLEALARLRDAGTAVDLEALYGYARQNKLKLLDGDIRRLIAKLLLSMGSDRAAEAEPWIRKAIGAHESHGMRWHLASDQVLRAEWLQQKGDTSGARETLQTAASIFTECGADGWVKMAEERLAKIS